MKAWTTVGGSDRNERYWECIVRYNAERHQKHETVITVKLCIWVLVWKSVGNRGSEEIFFNGVEGGFGDALPSALHTLLQNLCPLQWCKSPERIRLHHGSSDPENGHHPAPDSPGTEKRYKHYIYSWEWFQIHLLICVCEVCTHAHTNTRL